MTEFTQTIEAEDIETFEVEDIEAFEAEATDETGDDTEQAPQQAELAEVEQVPENGSAEEDQGADDEGEEPGAEVSLESVVDDILETIQGELLTMYLVAKVLNAALEVFDVRKGGEPYRVRPQMVYNYNKNKMVVKGMVADRATKAQTKEFVVRFVSKRI